MFVAATIIVFSVTFNLVSALGAIPSDYQYLRSSLFDNYSREVRPVINDSRPTAINLSLHLLSIVEVKEQDQALMLNAKLEFSWTDELLVWSPASYASIRTLLLPQKSLWKPDVVLGNPVNGQGRLGYDELLVRVNHTGRVRWSPTDVFETSCSIDVTYYPMDTQKCSIIFQPEMSKDNEIRLRVRGIQRDHYTDNGQWELVDVGAYDNVLTRDGIDAVEFQLKLRRRRFFYVLNIILPVVFLSLTSSLVFALPAEAGEKMGLSITVLLAYAVYLTLVTDAMPNTSMQVSLIAVYLMMLLGLCSVNVVFTVFILRLYYRDHSTPVHPRVARVITKLRKLFRYPDAQRAPSCTASDISDVAHISVMSLEEDTGGREGDSSTKNGKRLDHGRFGSRNLAVISPSIKIDQTDQRKERSPVHIKSGRKERFPTLRKSDQKSFSTAKFDPKSFSHTTSYLKPSSHTASDQKPFSQTKQCPIDVESMNSFEESGRRMSVVTDKMVAETLDFLLFLICTVLSLGTTVLCLLALIGGSATNFIDTSFT